MGSMVYVERGSLEAAKAHCLGKGTAKAAVSLSILALLIEPGCKSAKEVGKATGCSRSHVFNVARWIREGQFDRLTGGGAFRKERLLSLSQQEELAGKLGRELKCAKDVADWYGKDVPLATVHGWCRRLGFSFRRSRGPAPVPNESPNLGEPRCSLGGSLGAETVHDLRKRQAEERP